MTVAGQLRAGVRGARRGPGHRRRARRRTTWSSPRAASRSTTCGSATRRRATVSIASLEADAAAPLSTDPSATVLQGISFVAEPGPDGRPGRARRAPARPRLTYLVPRLYDVTAGAVRIDGHDVRDLTLGVPGRRHRRGQPGPPPVPRLHRRQPPLRQARRHRRRARRGVPGGPHPRRHRRPARRATTPSSASGATGCRAGRSSAWPSPGCCSRTRPSSILDEATSHLDSENEVLIQQALAEALAGPHVDRDRPPALDHPRRRPDPGARRRAGSSSGAPTTSWWQPGGLYSELYLTQYSPGAVSARLSSPARSTRSA